MSIKSLTGAALLGILLAAGGCARSGPTTDAILSPEGETPPYDLVVLTPATIAPYVLPPRVRPAAAVDRAGPSRYGVMPGDVLHVVIYERSDGGTFAPLSAGGTVFPAVRVDEEGSISLPYAGRLRVAGASLAQVAERITTVLAGRGIIEPRVHVQLAAGPSHSVLVSGEVRTPGRITTLDGPLTAVEAVARAGGPAQPAHMLDAVIYRGGRVQRIPYTELLAQPSLGLRQGDQIILEHNRKQFIAMGAVLRAGQHEMTAPRMSLLDGLGVAGGLSDRTANPSGVFLFRLPPGDARGPRARPTVFHLDFARAESLLLAQQFALRPDDAIYVSNAPFWEAQKFIAPILDVLILGRSTQALTR